MSSDVWTFFGVMMSLLTVGLLGYGGFVLINGIQVRIKLRDRVPPSLDPDEVEGLRGQAEELEHLKVRMLELEERVDFAERLLARPATAGNLPDPSK